MVYLTLVRHGQTKMNKANVVQSRTHGELTPEGVKMAENLGKALQNEKFTRIISSDLRRCHDTARNILKHSKHHDETHIVLNEVLRERDYGDFEFQKGTVVNDHVAKFDDPKIGFWNVPIPGGEDYNVLMQRVAKFFDELCHLADNAENDEHVLAVSHGCWIIAFLDHLAEKPDFHLENYDHKDPIKRPVRNTARTKLFIGKSNNGNNNGKRTIKFYDIVCAAHLSGME